MFNYKLYTFDNEFIVATNYFPAEHTGIIVYTSGTKEWWVGNKRHRLDGPAFITKTMKHWFVNGKKHRLDGPAIEWANGARQWYIDNKLISCKTNEEFKFLVDMMKLKGLL